LRPLQNQYRFALVFLDKEGSGQEHKSIDEIEAEIKNSLNRSGWENRSEVIVFDPELESWAWVNSTHVAKSLGWERYDDLKGFLSAKAFWQQDSTKPARPKEAFELALKEKRIQRSSSIYKRIAETVSFRECTEISFLKFRKILFNWFSA
jgi:hypothetical protein